MKKDTIIAIFIGFIIGLVAALTLVNFPHLLRKEIGISFQLPSFFSPSTGKQTVTDKKKSDKSENAFKITSPPDQSIQENSKITIKGTVPKNSTLIISTTTQDNIIDATDGSFTHDITLTEGANNFNITSLVDNGITETKRLTLFYTSEKL